MAITSSTSAVVALLALLAAFGLAHAELATPKNHRIIVKYNDPRREPAPEGPNPVLDEKKAALLTVDGVRKVTVLRALGMVIVHCRTSAVMEQLIGDLGQDPSVQLVSRDSTISIVLPEGAPEATPQPATQAAREAAPKAAPKAEPEAAPEAEPEAAPASEPESAPAAMPEPVPESTPETAPILP